MIFTLETQVYKKNFKLKFIKPFSHYKLSSRCFQILFSRYIRKWFEPRSNTPWLDMIIWVIGVPRMTAVGDRSSTTCAKAIFRVKWLDLKMTSAQAAKTSVTNSSPPQVPSHQTLIFNQGTPNIIALLLLLTTWPWNHNKVKFYKISFYVLRANKIISASGHGNLHEEQQRQLIQTIIYKNWEKQRESRAFHIQTIFISSLSPKVAPHLKTEIYGIVWFSSKLKQKRNH